jgi:hypothetical protein
VRESERENVRERERPRESARARERERERKKEIIFFFIFFSKKISVTIEPLSFGMKYSTKLQVDSSAADLTLTVMGCDGRLRPHTLAA